ncbi:hypothetical protein CFOL_v3_25390, partial [Cephalotus follicularis]
KRNKNELKQESTTRDVSTSYGTLSPGLAGRKQKNAIDSGLAADEVTPFQLIELTFCSKSPGENKGNCRKQISPFVFYGSPIGVPPKRPLSLLRLLHEIRIDLNEQIKLNLRKEVWATFPRQDEAVKVAKGHANVHVFSYQDHVNGQRRFLVSTYKEFWRRYKSMDFKFRYHYESFRR